MGFRNPINGGLDESLVLMTLRDETTGVRVLFAGQYWPGANTLYIARAFEDCGAIVRILNETSIYPAEWWSRPGKLIRKALMPLIRREWNSQLLELSEKFKPDLVYLSNAGFVSTKTLELLRSRGIPVMCFYHDITWNRPGDRFIEKVKYFDLVSTTRVWQEDLIRDAGARAVKIVRFGYDPLAHRPIACSGSANQEYEAEVTFVATNGPHRAKLLEQLLTGGFPHSFRLWGGFWNRLPGTSVILPFWQGRSIHEQEIRVIYANTKIALHWPRIEPESDDWMFRLGDQHNSRTFQIPACGGALMLALRTEEHLKFFEEDHEAVFFDDTEELKSKLGYWLDPSRDKARRDIVVAARERCLSEDYSYRPVVREYLQYFSLDMVGDPRQSRG